MHAALDNLKAKLAKSSDAGPDSVDLEDDDPPQDGPSPGPSDGPKDGPIDGPVDGPTNGMEDLELSSSGPSSRTASQEALS